MTDHNDPTTPSPRRPPRLVPVALNEIRCGDFVELVGGERPWRSFVVARAPDCVLLENGAMIDRPYIGYEAYRLTTDATDDPIAMLEEWRADGRDREWRILGPAVGDPRIEVLLSGFGNGAVGVGVLGHGPTLSAAVGEALAKAEGKA